MSNPFQSVNVSPMPARNGINRTMTKAKSGTSAKTPKSFAVIALLLFSDTFQALAAAPVSSGSTGACPPQHKVRRAVESFPGGELSPWATTRRSSETRYQQRASSGVIWPKPSIARTRRPDRRGQSHRQGISAVMRPSPESRRQGSTY